MSVVELKGVTVRRGKAFLLDGIDLRVARDEFVGIVGPTARGRPRS
jgi:ABC-type transporter Mla maintaining outer membrane lipid asymmetry ATPase subunit MlaF